MSSDEEIAEVEAVHNENFVEPTDGNDDQEGVLAVENKVQEELQRGEKRKASPEPERSTATSNENKGLTDVPRKRFRWCRMLTVLSGR